MTPPSSAPGLFCVKRGRRRQACYAKMASKVSAVSAVSAASAALAECGGRKFLCDMPTDNFIFLEMRFERTLGWGANFIKFMGLC